jgi:hypothetical protein
VRLGHAQYDLVVGPHHGCDFAEVRELRGVDVGVELLEADQVLQVGVHVR